MKELTEASCAADTIVADEVSSTFEKSNATTKTVLLLALGFLLGLGAVHFGL